MALLSGPLPHITNVRINLNSRWSADAGLVLAALSWGFNGNLIKLTVAAFPPLYYLGIRFLLAGVIMTALFWHKILQMPKKAWLWAVWAGAMLFGGFSLQTVGLQYTSPGISAFLTMTSFIFVPIFKALISRELPEGMLVIAVVLEALGMGLLFSGNSFVFGWGEMLTLLSAIMFAVHILVVDKAVRLTGTAALASVQVSVTGCLSLLAALFLEQYPGEFPMISVIAISYGVIFGSIGAYMVQTWAQRLTPPSHAGILLSLEAIFALMFSLFFGMDVLTRNGVMGLALVFLGTLVAEWPLNSKKQGCSRS